MARPMTFLPQWKQIPSRRAAFRLHEMARAWVRLAELAALIGLALPFGLFCEPWKKQSRRQWIGGLASSPCAPLTWPRWVVGPITPERSSSVDPKAYNRSHGFFAALKSQWGGSIITGWGRATEPPRPLLVKRPTWTSVQAQLNGELRMRGRSLTFVRCFLGHSILPMTHAYFGRAGWLLLLSSLAAVTPFTSFHRTDMRLRIRQRQRENDSSVAWGT